MHLDLLYTNALLMRRVALRQVASQCISHGTEYCYGLFCTTGCIKDDLPTSKSKIEIISNPRRNASRRTKSTVVEAGFRNAMFFVGMIVTAQLWPA